MKDETTTPQQPRSSAIQQLMESVRTPAPAPTPPPAPAPVQAAALTVGPVAMPGQSAAQVQAQAPAPVPQTINPDILSMIEGMGVAEDKRAAIAAQFQGLLTNTVQQVLTLLPQTVSTMQQEQAANQQAVDRFYTAYPDLKTNHAFVQFIAAQVEQEHPNLSAEEAWKMIGDEARKGLNIVRSEASHPTPPTSGSVVGQVPGSATTMEAARTSQISSFLQAQRRR